MRTRTGADTGLIVLASALVLGQLGLLLILVLKAADSIPRIDPIRVVSTESRFDTIRDSRVRSDRTVSYPPVKVDANETTDHVP